MKRDYEIPEMELVCMETEDVIRTSSSLENGGITGEPGGFDTGGEDF